MSSFNICLPNFNNAKYIFSREQFISMFPYSPVSLALQDTEADEVELIHSEVTPYILNYLSNTINCNILPIPEYNMTSASRYLLIPILGIVSSPLYPSFRETFPDVNLFTFPFNDPQYDQLLTYAIKNNWSELVDYLRDYTEINHWSNIGSIASAYYDRLNLFLKFIPRDIYSSYIMNEGQFINLIPESKDIFTTYYNYMECYHDGFTPEDLKDTDVDVLKSSIIGKAYSVLSYLVSLLKNNPNIHPNWSFKSYQYLSELVGDVTSVKLINSLPGLDDKHDHESFDIANFSDNIPLLGYLLDINATSYKDIYRKLLQDDDIHRIRSLNYTYERLKDFLDVVTPEQMHVHGYNYIRWSHYALMVLYDTSVEKNIELFDNLAHNLLSIYGRVGLYQIIIRDMKLGTRLCNNRPECYPYILQVLGYTSEEIASYG